MAVARRGARWWARPDGRVGLLTAGLAAAVAGGALALAGDGRWPAGPAGWAVAAALVAGSALADGFVVHLRVRRGGHAIGVTEIPMVAGLLAVAPALLVPARVLGGALGLLLLRRQRGPKLAFNVALVGAQAAVAALVLHAVAPDVLGRGEPRLSARDWAATYLAMIAADVVAAVLVTAAIALHDDPGEWRRLPASLRSVWMTAVTTTAALVGYLAVRQSPWALALIAVLTVVLYLAYRERARVSDGNAQVEHLYRFTRDLDGARELDELVAVVLDRTRDQLRAGVAALVVADGAGLRHTRLAGQAAAVTTAPGGADDDWLRPALDGAAVLRPDGTAMAVPLPLGEQRAALTVGDSLPDAGPFTEARLRLFEALANHARAALGRADLVDRLRREAAEKQYLSLHDPLSGLPNRRCFHQLLDAELTRARAAGGAVAVMLLDLDRFKEINDALGHDTGDALLREVGRRLRAHLSGRGVVARFGGDEFAVLLPLPGRTGGGTEEAAELARVVEAAMPIGPLTLTARASVGVACAPGDGDDPQTLIQRADVAMYAAKEQRAGVLAYGPALDRHSPQRLALVADLRVAVERRDLLVAYQPKVDPRDGRVVGAEALARWHHPVRGTVGPDEFIPLAEHSGLIRPLTLHVLEVALRRRAAWARRGHDLGIAVNLSPNVLFDADLPEIVDRLLARTGTAPGVLTCEITEGAILADPVGSRAILERLHGLGVKLSIDDFGTGYSSLGRLRELPIHEVKIDKSFVQRLAADHRDRAVVRSAVQLGHALDLEVVAEGVEDADTYAWLAREGCDTVQGYLLSRPLPPDAFLQWLDTHRPAAAPVLG